MEYGELSAIELQGEIDRADYYSDEMGPGLRDALKEVQRLRGVCQEIIETINTDGDFIYQDGDMERGVRKLEDIAGRYYLTENQSPTLEKL